MLEPSASVIRPCCSCKSAMDVYYANPRWFAPDRLPDAFIGGLRQQEQRNGSVALTRGDRRILFGLDRRQRWLADYTVATFSKLATVAGHQPQRSRAQLQPSRKWASEQGRAGNSLWTPGAREPDISTAELGCRGGPETSRYVNCHAVFSAVCFIRCKYKNIRAHS